jgi:hypothetical protein
LLDFGQRHAGFDRDRRVAGIDCANGTQARERYDNLAAGFVRRRCSAHTRVATLRDDGHVRLRACADDCSDLRGSGRPNDGARGPVITAAPVHDVGLEVRRCRQYMVVADDTRQSLEQGCVAIRHGARY